MAAQLNTIIEFFDGANGTSFAIGTAALVILLTIGKSDDFMSTFTLNTVRFQEIS